MNKKIVWLTGASGVGKTTLLENLQQKYSNQSTWGFLKFDSIGVPSSEEMIREFGSGENWQKAKTFEWIENMINGYPGTELIIMDGQANIEFIKEGFRKLSFKNYLIILIDCDQDTMVKRLTDERQQAWLASDDMKNWLKFLHNQATSFGLPIINTTSLDKTQVLAEFNNIIKNLE